MRKPTMIKKDGVLVNVKQTKTNPFKAHYSHKSKVTLPKLKCLQGDTDELGNRVEKE